jgi:hypothetical protein
MVLALDRIGDEQFGPLARGLHGSFALFAGQLHQSSGQWHQHRNADEDEAPEQAAMVQPSECLDPALHVCLQSIVRTSGSAPDDAFIERGTIGSIPKVQIHS